jgi:Tfp pilus assembly protein PilF
VKKFGVLSIAALTISAIYLYSWPAANLFYAGAVLFHVALGVVLCAVGLILLRDALRGPVIVKLGALVLAAGSVFGLALIYTGTSRVHWNLLYVHIAVSGVAVVLLAGWWFWRRSAARWSEAREAVSQTVPPLRGSVISPLDRGLTPTANSNTAAARLLHRGPGGVVPPTKSHSGWDPVSLKGPLYRVLAVAMVAIVVSFAANYARGSWSKRFAIRNPEAAPLSMDSEGDGAHGPFFPSSAQVAGNRRIPGRYFMESDACERCHQDIYKQWQSSAHHFSSFNNQWYRKSIEYMQEVEGTHPSRWCGGCHDPAVLYSGMMDTPIKQILDRPETQAGLGCMMCHSIVKVKSTMGQGDFVLDYPEMHELAASKNPVVRWLHDFSVKLNPEPHRRVFLKPFMKTQTPEFCSSCHKVHLDVPVNNYRWFRGFNEYDNWQASGVSGFGARSFYYPPKSQGCQDCHMPLTQSQDQGNIAGKVHSHSFPGANTALPFANQDQKQMELEQNFLKSGMVSIDIFALSTAAPEESRAGTQRPELQTTFAVGEEAEMQTTGEAAGPATPVTAPLDRTNPAVRRGESIRVDVVVRTRKVGHFFPGGTVDAFDTWVELKAVDDKGQTIFWSGSVADDGKGPVDPGAHFYRSLQVDEHGNPINKRNAWATRAVVYVHLIPPGAADTVRYRLKIPPNAGDKITLTARLCYRKFSWFNTHFSYAGQAKQDASGPQTTRSYDDRRFTFDADTSTVSGNVKRVPNLPIVALAGDSVELRVLPKGAPPPAPKVVTEKADWQRWNDYGIGLFLQGDLKGAAAAFQRVTEADPANPDGWVNLGRVAVQEGDMERARVVLQHALSLNPNLARANFFYARVLRSDGDYDGALQHLYNVAVQYPKDRVVRNEMGHILFLQHKYSDAMTQLREALAVDPEDLQANYHMMLCYKGLGDEQQAAEYQKRYLRFKADESAQTITGPYRRLHPEDNNERQSIHEHVSAPLGAASPLANVPHKVATAGGGH